MEAMKRLYIVSFGDSRKYRVEFEDVANVDPFHHTNPLASVEADISEYLEGFFPGESLAYFDTPKVTEVYWKDRAEYESYPVLDAAAVKDIEAELRKEVENREDQQRLDCNAPYAEINSELI